MMATTTPVKTTAMNATSMTLMATQPISVCLSPSDKLLVLNGLLRFGFGLAFLTE